MDDRHDIDRLVPVTSKGSPVECEIKVKSSSAVR